MSTIDLRADEYGAFCTAIRRLCGIDLSQYKRGQMERRIRTFAERRGITRLKDYAAILAGSKRGARGVPRPRHDQRLAAVAQPRAVGAAARKVLPEFAGRPRFKAWSAGSSYGAEAYTLAAVCAEALPGVRTEIVGTDIDRRMVERARAGVFSIGDARDVPARPARALVHRAGRHAARRSRAARAAAASRPATCSRCARRSRSTTSCCAATPSSTSRPTSRTRCTRASPRRSSPAATSWSARPSASPTPPRSASRSPTPSSTGGSAAMELDAYLPMFLAESREHLEHLNLAIVRIEEQPDDRETVDEIFRIAHSLKGMSATMGFAGMAALTHKMEDVFELLRQRTGGLERKVIDVLLPASTRSRAPSRRSTRPAPRRSTRSRSSSAWTPSSAPARRPRPPRSRVATSRRPTSSSAPTAAASAGLRAPRGGGADARRARLHGPQRARGARRAAAFHAERVRGRRVRRPPIDAWIASDAPSPRSPRRWPRSQTSPVCPRSPR